ncbi:MAG: AbrB/MazE/SpoVT family DNA-binding domain-containing protein [Planctomycetia bacterium]
MIQKLHKHDEGLALVIDRATLAAHGIDEDTPVEVAFSGTTMIVTASIDPERKAAFERSLAATHDRFGQALQKLAE